ncbi:MAG TPA: carboxypeptidase regulatory-like domain-containing protein [Bryobacteraceae bacterium]|nr:carboxypeptidase regulatory-like domain-containing protein [Bryobacteraceae bacterium]
MSPLLTISRTLVVCLWLASVLSAQTETGQIAGTVTDPTGAGVPNAPVEVKSATTGAIRTTTTSRAGDYTVTNLLPGTYQLTVAVSGFETVRQNADVTVGSRTGLDLRLKVGSASTVVQVNEAAAQVNTETQSLSQTISGQELAGLPTISRNPYDLVKTVGNVSDADPGGRGAGVAINGLRSSSTNILLDGVANNNEFDTTVAITVPQDSMREFTVVTSDFTAEYGRAAGGIVNVATKQGSNDFHGSVYEFNRVSALAANTFNNNAFEIKKPVFTRNQFGFSIGGPIKKDKLFFFDNAEWLRVRSVGPEQAVVATPQLIAASAANTRQFFNTYGHLKPDVAISTVFTRAGVGCTTAACLALPASTPLYETVTYKVATDAGGGTPENTWNDVGRIDYNMSDKTQMYFRYARYVENDFTGTQTNSPYVGYDTPNLFDNQGYALSITHAFSSRQVSQTKLSYNRITNIQPLGAQPVGPTLYTTLNSTKTLGNNNIVYPGYSPDSPGNAVPFGGPQNYVAINEDYNITAGKHNLRFGGQFTYLQDNRTFGAYEEAVEALGANTGDAVNGLLTGQLNQFQAAVNPQGKYPCVAGVATPDCTLTLPVGPPSFSRSNRFHEAALYAQDSWKVIPRLTVNLGLRWEYFGPPANSKPALNSNFYPGPGANIELQSATGTVQPAPSSPVGGLWAKQWTNFAPRVGFAWDVAGDGKTSIRGGYGIGYERNFNNVTFNIIQNPPNYAVIGLQNGVDVPTLPITIDNAGPLAGNSGTKALPPVTLRAVDPHIKTSYAHQWSFAIERQVTNDAIMGLEYTGSAGRDLYTINRLNLPGSARVYGGVGTATQRLNRQYSTNNFRTNGGTSFYSGLNTRLELRNFRNYGLTLRANYTWSHSIDDVSSTFTSDNNGTPNLGLLDPLNPGLDRGNSDFDVRHRVVVSAVWQEPFFKKRGLANAILGGWSVAPIFTARTGAPFTAFDCTNSDGNLCPRAVFTGTFHPHYTDVPTGNPNEFAYLPIPAPDSSYVNPLVGLSDFGPFPTGMIGRNSLTAPGAWTFNLEASKNFSITERVKLEIRGEAFDILNHSNLYIVWGNYDVGSLESSYMTATRGQNLSSSFTSATVNNGRLENRNIQLAVRLSF